MIIRTATARDVDAIARIGRVAMPAQYAGIVDLGAVDAAVAQTYAREALEACIERCDDDPGGHFLVAELAEEVVAYLHFDSLGAEPELHRLYADPGARGSGVGSALIEALHERLPAPGYMLLVLRGNDRAVAFYERHGLRVEGLVDGLAYYAKHMGVDFPPGTAPFSLVLMRRG